MRYGSQNPFDSQEDDCRAQKDLYIMEETVKHYIFGYPWHLEDTTISRPYSWPSEGLIELSGQVHSQLIVAQVLGIFQNSFQAVWVDDIYMGTALLSELAYHSKNQTYALQAAHDVLRLQRRLLSNPEEFILNHGFNNRTQHFSCCKWARGMDDFALKRKSISSLDLF